MLRTITFGLALIALGPLTTSAEAGRWEKDCRGYSPHQTVVCIATRQAPPGGVVEALSVWSCESGWGTPSEPPHSDPFHGPMQYLIETYASQRSQMPDLVRWYHLRPQVHDMRSNIITAIGWAKRHGWGPWTCATIG